MSIDNPYDFSDPSAVVTPKSGFSHGIIEELRMTRPWVRLMGVVGLLGCVLAVFGGGSMILLGLAGTGPGGVGPAAGPFLALGVGYLLFAFLYGYPCVKLLGYGKAITNFEQTATLADLEAALMQQRMFWRFVGILTAIIVGLYILLLGGGLLMGLLFSM